MVYLTHGHFYAHTKMSITSCDRTSPCSPPQILSALLQLIMHLQSAHFSQSVCFGNVPFLNHHINFSSSDSLDLEEFQDTTRDGVYWFSMPVENDRLVSSSVDDICKVCGCLPVYSVYIKEQVTKKETPERQQDFTLFPAVVLPFYCFWIQLSLLYCCNWA